MKSQEIAVIRWIDCAMHGNEQVSREDAEQSKLIYCVSSGLLIKEDKHRVVLAMDWFCENDSFREIHTYPKSGIIEIKKYKVKGFANDI